MELQIILDDLGDIVKPDYLQYSRAVRYFQPEIWK